MTPAVITSETTEVLDLGTTAANVITNFFGTISEMYHSYNETKIALAQIDAMAETKIREIDATREEHLKKIEKIHEERMRSIDVVSDLYAKQLEIEELPPETRIQIMKDFLQGMTNWFGQCNY